MCGIVGVFGIHDPNGVKKFLTHIDEISFRGPDNTGFWISKDNSCGMGHARLAVLDTSASGAQPFISSDGNLVITFNGEIYNHLEIRARLSLMGYNIHWRGMSDTETIIETILRLGLESSIQLLDGMFAFALWNINTKELTLARDRTGQKPLYISANHNRIAFSSDIRALFSVSNRELNSQAITDVLQFGYVRGTKSIYTDIEKVKPGFFQTFKLMHGKFEAISDSAYFETPKIDKEILPVGQEQEYFLNMLEGSVKKCMLSDVPIGSFLSGGIDSSLITALMQKNSINKVKTFTIGFDEKAFNESDHSQAIADYLGTEHTSINLTTKEIPKYLNDCINAYSEPFCDPSQIPTLMVSELASNSVTVALSGDGADELLGGYQRYLTGEKIYKFTQMSGILGRLGATTCIKTASEFLNILQKFTKNQTDYSHIVSKLHKAKAFINSPKDAELYDLVMSQFHQPKEIVKNYHRKSLSNPQKQIYSNDFKINLMAHDFKKYLVDDILVKVDRASMYYSLETRAPFLNNEFVNYAMSLHNSLLFKDGKGKYIARAALGKIVPSQLFERPKMGFGIPIGNWIRTILKEPITDALSTSNIEKVGILDTASAQRLLHDHLTYKYNNQYIIWNMYQLQSWALKYHHGS